MDFSTTAIVDATLWTLAGFSLITWSVIILKAGETALNAWRNRAFLAKFWPLVAYGRVQPAAYSKAQAARIYQAGLKTPAPATPAAASFPEAWHDLLERVLRQQIQKEQAVMESGLGWLASIGSTAPFVGLFGTVWGIMHALQGISAKGSASLDVVAGPIGEALIATALGIGVAIPAVIAYNFFLRQNRRILGTLEHFASDYLHSAMQYHLTQAMVNQHGYAAEE